MPNSRHAETAAALAAQQSCSTLSRNKPLVVATILLPTISLDSVELSKHIQASPAATSPHSPKPSSPPSSVEDNSQLDTLIREDENLEDEESDHSQLVAARSAETRLAAALTAEFLAKPPADVLLTPHSHGEQQQETRHDSVSADGGLPGKGQDSLSEFEYDDAPAAEFSGAMMGVEGINVSEDEQREGGLDTTTAAPSVPAGRRAVAAPPLPQDVGASPSHSMSSIGEEEIAHSVDMDVEEEQGSLAVANSPISAATPLRSRPSSNGAEAPESMSPITTSLQQPSRPTHIPFSLSTSQAADDAQPSMRGTLSGVSLVSRQQSESGYLDDSAWASGASPTGTGPGVAAHLLHDTATSNSSSQSQVSAQAERMLSVPTGTHASGSASRRQSSTGGLDAPLSPLSGGPRRSFTSEIGAVHEDRQASGEDLASEGEDVFQEKP